MDACLLLCTSVEAESRQYRARAQVRRSHVTSGGACVSVCVRVCVCCFESRLTHVELAVELQAGVSLRRRQAHLPVLLIQLQHSLLHITLGTDPVPLVIVEGGGRLYIQLHWPIANIEGEGHHITGWGGGE